MITICVHIINIYMEAITFELFCIIKNTDLTKLCSCYSETLEQFKDSMIPRTLIHNNENL